MVKSNQVQLLIESHTRALFLPHKLPFRAKIKVSHDTHKKFQRSDKRVFRVQGTHLGRNNWKIKKKIIRFCHTKALLFFFSKKRTTFWPNFPSWGIWPICAIFALIYANICSWRIFLHPHGHLGNETRLLNLFLEYQNDRSTLTKCRSSNMEQKRSKWECMVKFDSIRSERAWNMWNLAIG